jgi:hypothetical protein
LAGSVMVATLPSGRPVLKVKADGCMRGSSSSQCKRGLRGRTLVRCDAATKRRAKRRQDEENM